MQSHILRAAAGSQRGKSIRLRYSAGGANSGRIVFPSSGVSGILDWGDGSAPIVNPTGAHTKSFSSDSVAEFTGEISGGSVQLAGFTLTHIDDWIEGPERYFMENANDLVSIPGFLPRSVTSMERMFSRSSSIGPGFNGPINFNTSNVTNMSYMFYSNSTFNQPLNFDTSNVTTMDRMFAYARAFNQPLDFDTSSVIGRLQMTQMFRGAHAFNQDLSGWCVTNVTSIPSLFDDDTPAWIKTGRQPIWGTCP